VIRVLFIVVVAIVGLALLPFGLVYSFSKAFFSFKWNPLPKLGMYLHSLGLSLSRLLNVVCSDILNEAAITPDGYQFGDVNDTTSFVLGKNRKAGTLRPFGEFISAILDKVDPGHVEDATEIHSSEL
jgi:hypothetical protein